MADKLEEHIRTHKILDVLQNTSEGVFLIRGITETERDALSLTEGIVIYNTTSGIFQGYSASGWGNL